MISEPIGGIVVMCGVQAEAADGDIRVDGFKFPPGDNGADAVVPPGVQETDMEWEVKANACIVGAEHVKGVPEIKNLLIAVPSPAGIGVGEMAFAGTVGNAVLGALAYLMAIRGRM